MFNLPAQKHMPMTQADALLNDHFPAIADLVEDYELRGNTHYYYLSTEDFVTVNRRQVVMNRPNHRIPKTVIAVFSEE